jgi:hypothetical protein
MRFSWDAKKAAANLRKRGVSFEEASTVFRDALSVTGSDPDHSVRERRFVTFSNSSRNRLLVVAHTEEGDDIRIISARPVTRQERKIYEEGEQLTNFGLSTSARILASLYAVSTPPESLPRPTLSFLNPRLRKHSQTIARSMRRCGDFSTLQRPRQA